MSQLFTLRLAEVQDKHHQLIGGKAFSLARLCRLCADSPDVVVPDGFCWTVTASTALIGAVHEQYATEASAIDSSRERLIGLTERLQAQILTCRFPGPLVEEVKVRCAQLGWVRGLAVRSSGLEEDGSGASFAGQHTTRLGVHDLEEVLEAIRECLASGYTYSVLRYRQRHDFALLGQPMPVIVQQLVDARSAGVMLTRDPRGTGESSWIEAVWGIGELLVSGEATPDSFEIDRAHYRLTQARIARKPEEYTWKPGGLRKVAVDPARQESPAISLDEVERLARLGQHLERCFGYPLEVEWAVGRDGLLYLLQARPLKFR